MLVCWTPDSLPACLRTVHSNCGFTYEFRVPWCIAIMPATAGMGFKPTQQFREHSAVVEALLSAHAVAQAAEAGLRGCRVGRERDRWLVMGGSGAAENDGNSAKSNSALRAWLGCGSPK
jgi:hypothetical protein